MPIFEGLPEICDQWLGIDENYPGVTLPRYQHRGAINALYSNSNYNWPGHSGQVLLSNLLARMLVNWSGSACRSQENWRFEKRLNIDPKNTNAETILERAIARITDENWVNQVPTASGIDNTGGSHLDLVHRRGNSYTFFELKVASNNPIYAAFQAIRHGMIFMFSRIQYQSLYGAPVPEILDASDAALSVLAPYDYYQNDKNDWLWGFEQSLNNGLREFSKKFRASPTSFRFEAFPDNFHWNANDVNQENSQKDLLWALHQRVPLFP